ncbi:MAG: uridine kinase [Terriglobia bacterium]
MSFNSPCLIGIAGGTGTGKTSAARHLAGRYATTGVAVVDQDSYYIDRSHLPPAERARLNYDEPSAIDHDLLLSHLKQLLQGSIVQKPRYRYATHTRATESDAVAPAPLIILEGLFALWDPRACEIMALKVYLDADSDIRFIRRAQRDIAQRGRTMDSIITQYLQTVRPMHQMHIEPTRKRADLVLDISSGTYAALDAQVDRVLFAHSAPQPHSSP